MKHNRFCLLSLLSLLVLYILCGCAASAEERSHIQVMSTTPVEGTTIFHSSLAVSSTGKPYIAYVSDTPRYVIRVAQIGEPAETVGIAGNQRRNLITLSLSLNPDEQPGLAYVDDREGDLVYAERRAGQWITETVDVQGWVGYFPSLVYDRRGTPHISYFDQTNNDIKYAMRTDRGWHIETIDASGQPGFHLPTGFTRLALSCEPDSEQCDTQRPHVAYLFARYKSGDGALRYATRHDWGWKIETVDADRGTGEFPSLQLDHQGHPWISYYRISTWDFVQGELRLAHSNGETWQVEVVDAQENAGRHNMLALTADDRPVIAYYAERPADVKMAWWDNGWHTETS